VESWEWWALILKLPLTPFSSFLRISFGDIVGIFNHRPVQSPLEDGLRDVRSQFPGVDVLALQPSGSAVAVLFSPPLGEVCLPLLIPS